MGFAGYELGGKNVNILCMQVILHLKHLTLPRFRDVGYNVALFFSIPRQPDDTSDAAAPHHHLYTVHELYYLSSSRSFSLYYAKQAILL